MRLVTDVPDNTLRPLIQGLRLDSPIPACTTMWEQEPVGIVTGAWTSELRGRRDIADQRIRDIA
jgi:hypothetical protein